MSYKEIHTIHVGHVRFSRVKHKVLLQNMKFENKFSIKNIVFQTRKTLQKQGFVTKNEILKQILQYNINNRYNF